MLDIVLKILSVTGIVLLVLLAVLLILLLLVLFFPITYRAFGKKNEKELTAWLKANWLFGLLRVRFFYPKPGNLVVKVLWFTLYDSSGKPLKEEEGDNETSSKQGEQGQEQGQGEQIQETKSGQDSSQRNESQKESDNRVKSEENHTDAEALPEPEPPKTIKERIFAKYEKLKYTILKIYDKIKHIVENITFYKTLFQDEQTQGLLKHAMFRLGRIWKNIRPRKLKGDILFGTGEPDTTGYAFGIYGMLSPYLGKHMNVTPDFTQAILEGELYAAGHITVFQLLLHGLKLAFDKRLRLLIHRIKTHKI